MFDRIVGCTELGMGGPTIEFYLLKERVVFGGVYIHPFMFHVFSITMAEVLLETIFMLKV